MPKKTKQDPTGQAANRNRSTRRLSARVTKAEADVRALFRAIPRTRRRKAKIANREQTTIYDYEYSPRDQDVIEQSIGFILNDNLLEAQTGFMPFDWFWKKDVELSYRQGTLEEVRDFNGLVAGAVTAGVLIAGLPPQPVEVQQVLQSEQYRETLLTIQATNFQDITSLSEKTSAQVIQRINAGISAKESPRTIINDIKERFDVSRASAKRIAVTNINWAYNDAKLQATDILGERTGLRAGVIHISALLPTTRAHHAARHGNSYTTEDQAQWWNRGANRINCHCTTRTVLIDRSGNVIDVDLQVDIRTDRGFFGLDS